LTITAGVLALLGQQLNAAGDTTGRWLGFAAAGAAALVPVVLRGADREKTAAWVQARSVAESYKTVVYSFLAGVYGNEYTGPSDMLSTETTRLEADVKLLPYTLGVQPRSRALPHVDDVDSYISVRISSQIEGYYLRNARRQQRLANLARRSETSLAASAAGLAAAGAAHLANIGAWAAVATTIGGAVAAHAAQQRYGLRVIEYMRTAAELSRLVTEHGDPKNSSSKTRRLYDAEFIQRCENAISAQNNQWMARWGGGAQDAVKPTTKSAI
jgi:hypothetical protein